ncbi:MAG: type II secretion system protein [Candidatus Omnitrophica bacterium]|nr:type II secretion system protein [Candidatus Omnitrophota bacterium]MBI3083009.1 type II secretion system protein [Candidatus Omnitrophota bacterium]
MWSYTRTRQRGLTYLEVVIVVGIVALLATLALSQPGRGRITANEQAAVQSLRTIFSGLGWYRTINNSFPTNLSTLASATPPYIDASLASGIRQGYLFAYTRGQAAEQFTMIATPQFPGVTGVSTFLMDESGAIGTTTIPGMGGEGSPGIIVGVAGMQDKK